ncbi:winged helix DNA-binding protein [Thermus brockianus]|jgi:hypothetical protein|nr:MarR family winged helix-turn-helix transcriptional regulator [Thermus brockianus]
MLRKPLLSCTLYPPQGAKVYLPDLKGGPSVWMRDKALAALERKGLLVREKDPKDGRRFRLAPTAEGGRLAEALKGYAQPLRKALAGVDAEALLIPLMALLEGLVRQGVMADTGLCLTCRHLRREGGFYCALLRLHLAPEDLRLACPDHAPA